MNIISTSHIVDLDVIEKERTRISNDAILLGVNTGVTNNSIAVDMPDTPLQTEAVKQTAVEISVAKQTANSTVDVLAGASIVVSQAERKASDISKLVKKETPVVNTDADAEFNPFAQKKNNR